MTRTELTEIINALKAKFDNRPRSRDGMLKYLVAVYKCARTKAIGKAVVRRLSRTPRTTNRFAHLIELSSGLDPKTRWKYAKVLETASKLDVKYKDFENFVKKKGGFNAVNKPARASKLKQSPKNGSKIGLRRK